MNHEDNRFCVYVHKGSEGVVKYVGSGTADRAFKNHANSCRGEKYAQYIDTNGKLEVEIVADGLSKFEAEELERELYDKYGETLLNHHRPVSVKSMTKNMFEEHLYYDETSKSCLRWKINGIGRGGHKIKANSEAGSLHKTGYYLIGLQGKLHKAHRIVCVLHNIEVDGMVVDHIDRNKVNNKISNLRAVTQKENSQNMSISSRNTSGVQGVYYEKHQDRWAVSWQEDGRFKRKYFPVKNYTSSEEAFQDAVEHRNRMVALYYKNK